jgi:hypothetical protein
VEVFETYKNSVRTSQETHHVSATKPNRLVLFRETVAVCCENHTEHTNKLRGQNAEYSCVKVRGIHDNQCVLNGYDSFNMTSVYYQ